MNACELMKEKKLPTKITFGFQSLNPEKDNAVAIEEKIYLLAEKFNALIDYLESEQ